jgi:hypothetical protein
MKPVIGMNCKNRANNRVCDLASGKNGRLWEWHIFCIYSQRANGKRYTCCRTGLFKIIFWASAKTLTALMTGNSVKFPFVINSTPAIIVGNHTKVQVRTRMQEN